MKSINIGEITERAVVDALMFGMGVMLIRNDEKNGMTFEYVPREQYEGLIEALRWQKDENKGKMQ